MNTGELASESVKIGISGWLYPPWRGVFYPAKLRQADELHFASRTFSSIEINGSFYSLKRPATYQNWYEQTPPGFVFAVKGGRFVTILWQLPPTLGFDADRLRRFFDDLPQTTEELSRLAKDHDRWLRGRVAVEARHTGPMRHALEVRHPSFLDPRYIDILREYGVASCVADTAGKFPVIEDLTADFAYARLHGSRRLYTSGYTDRELGIWAQRVRTWRREVSAVYVYFDNDVKVRAPFDALNLERLLRGEATRRPPRSIRSVTEEPRV